MGFPFSKVQPLTLLPYLSHARCSAKGKALKEIGELFTGNQADRAWIQSFGSTRQCHKTPKKEIKISAGH